MSFEKVNEVPFTLRRRQRSTLGQYWATMGFIFQILRDIHPNLKIGIDTMTLIGILWSCRTGLNLFLTLCGGWYRFSTSLCSTSREAKAILIMKADKFALFPCLPSSHGVANESHLCSPFSPSLLPDVLQGSGPMSGLVSGD